MYNVMQVSVTLLPKLWPPDLGSFYERQFEQDRIHCADLVLDMLDEE